MSWPLYSMIRAPLGIFLKAKTPRPWIGERRTAMRRRLLDSCMTTPEFHELLRSTLAVDLLDKSQHALGRGWVLILRVKPLAHAIDFAALQTLVELPALAERRHHHVRRERHQAQLRLRARRAAAKVTLHEGADLAIVQLRGAAAKHQRAGEQTFQGALGAVRGFDAVHAIGRAQARRPGAAGTHIAFRFGDLDARTQDLDVLHQARKQDLRARALIAPAVFGEQLRDAEKAFELGDQPDHGRVLRP